MKRKSTPASVWDWLNNGVRGEAFRITFLCSLAGTFGGAFTGMGAGFGFVLAFAICAVLFGTIAAIFAMIDAVTLLIAQRRDNREQQ